MTRGRVRDRCAVWIVLLLLGGCGSAAGPKLEGTELAQMEAGWNTVTPGGETTCALGTPYRFFVRRADPRKLVVFFQGGGACWSGETCDPDRPSPTYDSAVEAEDDPAGYPEGIFDFENAENPFRDYSMVFVPYCTGDNHLGDSTATYRAGGSALTIQHRGYRNARAALDWAFRNVLAPDTVFVTGESAGAIPSPLYAGVIAGRYPEARVAQFGDGAGGYRFEPGVSRALMEQWGIFEVAEALTGEPVADRENVHLTEFYVRAARAHPGVSFALFDTAEDEVQRRFIRRITGAGPASLLSLIRANRAEIEAEAPGVRTYLAPGDRHVILSRPEFYTLTSGGVQLRDWVAGLVAGRPVGDVACEGCGR